MYVSLLFRRGTSLFRLRYEECSEVYVEGPNGIRDEGRGKVGSVGFARHFADFMQHPNVKDAELTRSHVAGLRLYSPDKRVEPLQ